MSYQKEWKRDRNLNRKVWREKYGHCLSDYNSCGSGCLGLPYGMVKKTK